LTRFVEQHKEFIRQEKITFFEISTALAFWHFRQMGVEIAVVEVGLGGRLDATNVLKPILSVITQIDFDHTRILGSSLEKIAYEKAGIIKPGVPLITGEVRKELCELFESICQERDTTLSATAAAPERFWYHDNRMVFEMQRNGTGKMELMSPLVGPHQLRNIGVVAAGLELLSQQGIRISDRSFIDGVRNCRWPARFQMVSGKPTILLDVAHNPAGMDQLVKTFRIAYPGRKATVLFGVLDRPDYDLMLRLLKGITKRLVISRPNYWRGASLEGVTAAAKGVGLDSHVEPEVKDGVDRVLQWVSQDDILLICGSHFTVGEAILRLSEKRRRGELPSLSADITYIHE
jgi:dihydrofolate synthase/folylpolyglutamate synthase